MRLIDAEPLIEEARVMMDIEWNHKVAPVSWADAEDEFIARLEEAPTIDPSSLVKRARWKPYGRNLGECSECGEVVATRYRYCPNCSAKMIDGEAGEDEQQ